MGGGKGGSVYQSEYMDEIDPLQFQTAIGMLSGYSPATNPALASSTIAQQFGGEYDPKSGNIKMPDGSSIRFDPAANTFIGTGGPSGGASSADLTRLQNARDIKVQNGLSTADIDRQIAAAQQAASAQAGAGGDYLNQANAAYTDFQAQVINNPASPYHLSETFGKQVYNPATGMYEQPTYDESGQMIGPQQMGTDYYMDQYGGFLKDQYQPGAYTGFNYTSPTIGSVSNISDQARENIYQQGAENILQGARTQGQQVQDFVSEQGGSLSGGRAMRLGQDVEAEKNRSLQGLRRQVDTEHELRNYDEARHVRDAQAAQDFETQSRQGGEARYGQEFGQAEQRYGFEAGQKQGAQGLASAQALDAAMRDQAFQELQAERQQKLAQLSGLLDLGKLYAGQDSNAVQLEAAKSQAIGSALGGIASLSPF